MSAEKRDLKEVTGKVKQLERANRDLKDRVTVLERTVQAHSHSINDETVMAIVAFVKQEIAKTLLPPQSPSSEAPVQEQSEAEKQVS